MDCSFVAAALPPELLDLILNKTNEEFLSQLSHILLDSRHTDTCFPSLEPLLAELCARWLQLENTSSVVAALGRIVPFQSHLAECTESLLNRFELTRDAWNHWPQAQLQELLLGLYRLLVDNTDVFVGSLKPTALLFGLNHDSRPIRYLTIRIFCVYLHAADAAMEEMISKYLGDTAIEGTWESKSIDFRFLTLWEERRRKDVRQALTRSREMRKPGITDKENQENPRILREKDLRGSAEILGQLVPKLPKDSAQPTRTLPPKAILVATQTTVENMQRFTDAILAPRPVLLTGLAGSGKTAMVTHLAESLDKLESMVTLHVNEQTDAKTLIGLYTSGSRPGAFAWRPGALTTAVREGRWVLIEDLDRAPNEIISTLLPLIERGELLLPSRAETIKAASGFKLIATMRTSLGIEGVEKVSGLHLTGSRFWNRVPVKTLNDDELVQIIKSKYSALAGQSRHLVDLYAKVRTLSQAQLFSAEIKTGSARPVTPRDLFTWCRRIQHLLQDSSKFTDGDLDTLFLETVDCFAGYLPSGRAYDSITSLVAQELYINPQRRDHLLNNRLIKLELSNQGARRIRIGRALLLSDPHSQPRNVRRAPFSTNNDTLRLMERIAIAVQNLEPLLLVGETGTGKTTCIQHLANLAGKRLVPFNLSQQSESGDLLGGFKPVNIRGLVLAVQDDFDELFQMSFSQKENQSFSELLSKCIAKGQWRRVCKLWQGALAEVEKNLRSYSDSKSPSPEGSHTRKRQKLETDGTSGTRISNLVSLQPRWHKLAQAVNDIASRLASKSNAFAFTFVEGNIVKAVRNGDWVLLDEINLASPDTLEAIIDLLSGTDGGAPSLLLTESGTIERVAAHPGFRVFAAMNPATDVGKKDLPLGIRSRFTELFVESPDRNLKSLQHIVQSYLGDNVLDKTIVSDISKLYLEIQELSDSNRLVDGAGQKPHFSLRTLTRTLTFAKDVAQLCSLRRGAYEGFHMNFLTFLDKASENVLAPLITEHIFGRNPNAMSELRKPMRMPTDGQVYIKHRHFWLRQGNFPVEEQLHYIVTPFVQRNMDNLIRATFTRRYPVLIQGPTSSGKTSMIEHLAKISGNKFVRINNHEHTDLQEYLGTYVSTADGQLVFQEGILTEALRNGYWIVLDELNLAPSDVLEALNSLLDDNRELLIPETQETIRPHDNFMLFATQNPAGLYGGRKNLSRAFRNRFLELHFDDIPVEELAEILQRRTQIPESWGRRIVDVYKELSQIRQETRIFEQKSFATLRDLFRWALRKADTVEQLAINGYMLLAERVRKPEERTKLKEVIETVMSKRGVKVVIDVEKLYSATNSPEIALFQAQKISHDAVWTKAMRRLFVLVAHALRNNEPVLLVGETGSGKTTVCQMLADAAGKSLHVVNAHQNTETGDIIGSQRPIRNRAGIEQELRDVLMHVLNQGQSTETTNQLLERFDGLDTLIRNRLDSKTLQVLNSLRHRLSALFEWSDGGLVTAMRTGHFFLLDEISLADDSVLERLNSVLEPARALLLAEKGPVDSEIRAVDGFQFLATMNPGGDYGKRELSPALRNRFTEIWVPSIHDMEDVLDIVKAKLNPINNSLGYPIVKFSQWFNKRHNKSATSSISLRDVLAWVDFVNRFARTDPMLAMLHGASMVFIDTLGANPAGLLSISQDSVPGERRSCVEELNRLLNIDQTGQYFRVPEIFSNAEVVRVDGFALARSELATDDMSFTFKAPTTKFNAMRLFRALQLIKPILIEGNPGVGKSTLVSAIAKLVGQKLVRINLSEQTDLMDLFGSDVPVEGAGVGTFAWRDAPFLNAMKNGNWVLLDEMNLASQSVLEGLNACLDHRGEAYIAELNQTFRRHSNFRLFAAQNPHHQGGGRKGLPASFVNRFTVVYADSFTPEDLMVICKQLYTDISSEFIGRLTTFVAELDTAARQNHRFGTQGGPWEFNLRDTVRWLQLMTERKPLLSAGQPYDFCDLIFRRRFRSQADMAFVDNLFSTIFNTPIGNRSFYHALGPHEYQIGLAFIKRDAVYSAVANPKGIFPRLLLPVLEGLMICVEQNWPVILAGSPGSGKTIVLQHLAAATGATLVVMPMNADIDSMDLVGGYEQVDRTRQSFQYTSQLKTFLQRQATSAFVSGDAPAAIQAIDVLSKCIDYGTISDKATIDGISIFLKQLKQSAESQSLLDQGEAILNTSNEPEKPQFEWIDGLLVQALEHGDWLVLDNANLCSSSVLDRLNSLLEPNGTLIINEHAAQDGEARVIKPHPNFRIFLTMDPRNGELSRAMRNRAIELFVPLEISATSTLESISLTLESRIDRFSHLTEYASALTANNSDIGVHANLASQILSLADLRTEPHFQDQLRQGLLGPGKLEVAQRLENAIDNKHPLWVAKASEALELSISTLQDGSYLQSFHPLNNVTLANWRPENIAVSQHLAEVLDILSRAFDLVFTPDTRHRIFEIQSYKDINSSQKYSLSRGSASTYLLKLAQYMEIAISSLVTCATTYLQQPNRDDKAALPLMDDIQNIWQYLHRRVENQDIDELQMRMCVMTLRDYLRHFCDVKALNFVGEQTRVLDDYLPLKISQSGKHMEGFWEALKPWTPPTRQSFEDLITLEQLADRFDGLQWDSQVPASQLVHIRESFAIAMQLIMEGRPETDSRALINGLEEVLTGMVRMDRELAVTLRPFFRLEFEQVCKRFYLHLASKETNLETLGSLHLHAAIFAEIPTKSLMMTTSSKPGDADNYHILHYLSRYVGVGDRSEDSLDSGVSLERSIANKLASVSNVKLRELDIFRQELSALGQTLAVAGNMLVQDEQIVLDKLLKTMVEIVVAHLANAPSYLDNPGEIGYMLRFLQPAQSHLNNKEKDPKHRALAFVQLALGCIFAYVPDSPFDPLIKRHVDQDMQWNKIQDLRTTQGALERLERWFTGGDTSLRSRSLDAKILRLGHVKQPSENSMAQRPQASQMNELQREFDRVLLIAQSLNDRIQRGDIVTDLPTVQNLHQIIQRLKGNYRAYDDINEPLIGFLNCLLIGLELFERHQHQSDHHQSFHELLCSGNAKPMEALSTAESPAPLLRALHRFASRRSVSNGIPAQLVEEFQDVLRYLYQQWKAKIHLEQNLHAKKSSLYSFRGGPDEDEALDDEEFNDMFPDYEQPNEPGKEHASNGGMSLRDIAVQVSDLHSQLISSAEKPSSSIVQYLTEDTYMNPADNLASLPAIFLRVQQKQDKIALTAPEAGTYNIYKDSNLAEAQKIVELVRKIQRRFKEIQAVWPEHATLAEVLKICDEVLDFKHVEPVIKFLTKTEKLHETINEWQKVASKEYSATTLYDDITKLLVSWRRLELTTWTKLFDIETRRCADDAQGWWFLAYETIIEASEAIIAAGESASEHSKGLLRTLEAFFESTTLGQFRPRLELLSCFLRDIKLRLDTNPQFVVVHDALANFLSFYRRFQQPIQASLAKGRETLEKGVKEVALLASWRDTNIDALRQSAKASHRKLFKLVRKYRALLNQGISGIILQGPPDGAAETFPRARLELRPSGPDVSSEAMAICESQFTDWRTVPSRFKNVPTTLNLMWRLYSDSKGSLDGSIQIDHFVSNLEESISELQKATPSTLTDENKESVKHLKTRKRALLADVLKQLRRMGFQYNLSSQILSKQSSLSTIFATLPAIGEDDLSMTLRQSEYFFHKTLGLMTGVRDVVREHSGDLTPAEVTRSAGYLEGLLQHDILQRALLARLLPELRQFKASLTTIEALWASRTEPFVAPSPSQFDHEFERLLHTISWLIPMCKVFSEIVTVQSRLGKFDASAVLSPLNHWTEKFVFYKEEVDKLPQVPTRIFTAAHKSTLDSGKTLLQDFTEEIKIWIVSMPSLSPVLEQLVPFAAFTEINSNGRVIQSTVTVDEFRRELFDYVDLILASMQSMEKAQGDLPASDETASWFTTESSSRSAAAKAVHIGAMNSRLGQLLRTLPRLTTEDLQTASALFAIALPVLGRYFVIANAVFASLSDLHCSTCKLSYRLARSFVHLGKQGFCTPPEKGGDGEKGSDKLEGGTGLGDGEGAEDISKDVGDDEDLTELAEQPNEKSEKEIEDEQDAVDMADADMEGQMGETAEQDEEDGSKNEEDEETGEDGMEEEVGDVDDLGPSTVDEKMWDEGGKSDKEKKDDQGKGSKQDEQVAAENDGAENSADEAGEMEAPADEPEAVGQDQLESSDQHLPEVDTLDLPEDMNLEGQDQDDSDDDLMKDIPGDMNDLGEPEADNIDDAMDDKDAVSPEADAFNDDDVEGLEKEDVLGEQASQIGEDEGSNVEGEDVEEVADFEETGSESNEDADASLKTQDNSNAAEDAVQSENKGAGLDANDQADQADQAATAGASKQEQGPAKEDQNDEATASGEKGSNEQSGVVDSVGRSEDIQDAQDAQPFKKLGDILEKWYNQNRPVRPAQEDNQDATRQEKDDVDMADVDFEHLLNETSQADAQALGAATEDQARGFDEDNAISTNDENAQTFAEETEGPDEDITMPDVQNTAHGKQEPDNSNPKTFIGDQRSSDRQNIDMDGRRASSESDVEDVDTRLSTIEITSDPDSSFISANAARTLWAEHEASTRTLAATLAEQLRLILAPTMATKLRGDFRTGKRLNIKRIIPYIASSYKRDKIWMRRSVPSKRSYQIMIALDDSKSMADDEGQPGSKKDLAFETLALLAKALAVLEAGELCVAGFGADVRVAHPFGKPFTDEAGVEVFQNFTFKQGKTDVRKLANEAIELFRGARAKASGATAELWQLMLVVSDGVCDDHESIRRLVREAQDERIMIVFVVVDRQSEDGKAQSIMDLQTAEFGTDEAGDMKLVRKKYMDTFPFRWWLVVRDVRELPGVLSTALRQWFSEVADTSG